MVILFSYARVYFLKRGGGGGFCLMLFRGVHRNLLEQGLGPAPKDLEPLWIVLSMRGHFLEPCHPGMSGKGHSPLGWSVLWHILQWNGGVLIFLVPRKLAE